MARITVKQVEEALRDKRGNIAAAARMLGVNRSTIYRRIEDSPTLQEVLEDERETMLDNAGTELYDQALSGNTAALIFFLKTQGKSRGYTERQEITGADGDALAVRFVWTEANDPND